jgi:hypothetical protein
LNKKRPEEESTSYRLNRKTAEPKDAGDKWAQQDGSNDGNTAKQIGTKFPIQELPKQVIEKRQTFS